MHQELTDEDLAELVRDGHAERWEELALRVIAYARRRIVNHVPHSDREDVEQDVVIRFWRALPSFWRERGALKGFAAVITQRQIAEYWRARGNAGEAEPVDDWILEVAEAARPGGNPAPDLEAWIDEVLGPENGKMLRMHIFEGYRYAEIAAQLDVSEDAAKQRVYNARKALRARIEATHG